MVWDDVLVWPADMDGCILQIPLSGIDVRANDYNKTRIRKVLQRNAEQAVDKALDELAKRGWIR